MKSNELSGLVAWVTHMSLLIFLVICFVQSIICHFLHLKNTCMKIFLQGVVGSITSSKSALIHRYLTGECPKEERLNGCHKKEVLVDGQSYLLLVRNETGSPDAQVKLKN